MEKIENEIQDTLLGNKSELFTRNFNFTHFHKMELLGEAQKFKKVKAQYMTTCVKVLDKRRRIL